MKFHIVHPEVIYNKSLTRICKSFYMKGKSFTEMVNRLENNNRYKGHIIDCTIVLWLDNDERFEFKWNEIFFTKSRIRRSKELDKSLNLIQ